MMKKIIKILLLIIVILTTPIVEAKAKLPKSTRPATFIGINQKTMYTSRDSILRLNATCDGTYEPTCLVTDRIIMTVIKGTPVIVDQISQNGVYYHVTIKADGIFYLKDREGYIIAKSLKDNEVKKANYKYRTLTVTDKSIAIKNAMTIYKESNKVAFRYPTSNRINEENDKQNKSYVKGDYRITGYDYVLNKKAGIPTKVTEDGKKLKYFSCSSFVDTVYQLTFISNPVQVRKDKDGKYQQRNVLNWAEDYATQAVQGTNKNQNDILFQKYYAPMQLTHDGNNKAILTTATVTKKNSEKRYEYTRNSEYKNTIPTSKLQTGDIIAGQRYTNVGGYKPHVMMYIGDALVMHSAGGTDDASGKLLDLSIDYVDKKGKKFTSIDEVGQTNIRFNKYVTVARLKHNYSRARRRISRNSETGNYKITVLKEKIKK